MPKEDDTPAPTTAVERVRREMSLAGRLGGAAASGDKKRRSPEHYRRMVETRRANKLRRQLEGK